MILLKDDLLSMWIEALFLRRASFGGLLRGDMGQWIVGFSGFVRFVEVLKVELLAIFIVCACIETWVFSQVALLKWL